MGTAKELGKFDVILADYPWPFEISIYSKKKKYEAKDQYDLLTIEEGKRLNISSIANKDCWLFMWAVWARLPECIEIMEEWGFKYRTCAFVWCKRTVNGKKAKNFSRSCGAQGSTEIVLLGKRGRPKHYTNNEEQEFEAERTSHSRKPDILYSKIDKIVTPPDGGLRKIELFARRQYGDWHALGNDKELDVANPLCIHGDIRDLIGFKDGEN